MVQVKIPIQQRTDEASVTEMKSQRRTTETLNNALVLNALLSYAFNSVMGLVWSAANILQVITLYPSIDVTFSPNTIEMFSSIYNVVSFDLLPWVIMGPIQNFVI